MKYYKGWKLVVASQISYLRPCVVYEFHITLTTKTFCILLQCSLGIDVMENFHYMNGVNKTNRKKKNISSCATLKEAFTAEYNGVLRRTH